MSITKIAKFPISSEAIGFLLLAAVFVVQAQRAVLSVHFKRQNQDGSIDIALNCTLRGLNDALLYSYGPCSILWHIQGQTSQLGELASSGDWTERNDPQSGKHCDQHEVKLVTTVPENQVVSNDGSQNKALPKISSEYGSYLSCTRGFSYCTGGGDDVGGVSNLLGERCRFNVTKEYVESSQESASYLQLTYERSAKIRVRSTPENKFIGNTLNIPYNGNLILECTVKNLKDLPENRCNWLFVNNQRKATRSFFTAGQKSLVVPGSTPNRAPSSQKENPKRPYACLLELRGVDETLEGGWSCNPSQGQQDGFISPSTPVNIKVVDGCTSHSNCSETNEVCLNATEKVPRRICGNPCDQERPKHMCGNLRNSFCRVDKNTPTGIVCPCSEGYGSDTGFVKNQTRCLNRCTKNRDCLAVPAAVCIAVRINTGRCFPVCDVQEPQCGSGARCLKIPPNYYTDASWTSRCECTAGRFENPLSPKSSFECELPIFEGLHMKITIGGEQRDIFSLSQANSNGRSQSIVTAAEGSILQATCEAPRVFPAATLELGLTKFSRENGSAVESDDGDSSHGEEPPSQLPPNITVESLHDQLGAGYRGQLPAMKVTIADHYATFVCKLTSEAFDATVIEMKLKVTRLDSAAVTVSAVAGITAASLVAVMVLGAIVIVAIKHRQRGQQRQAANEYNIVFHDHKRNSALVEEDHVDDGEYEEVAQYSQPRTDVQHHESPPAVDPAHEHRLCLSPDPPAIRSSKYCREQENVYF